MILSGSLVAVVAAKIKSGNIIGVALSLLGIAIGAIAFVNGMIELGVILFVAGLVLVPMQASIATLLQTSVDNKMLGRVGSAVNSIVSVASLVSMGLAGVLAQEVGVRNVVLMGGGLALLAGLSSIVMLRAPKLQEPQVVDGGLNPLTPANS